MKHKGLHWETASQKQKVGYLLSKLGFKPEIPMDAFGKQIGVRFMFSAEQLTRMNFTDAANLITNHIQSKRIALLEEIDGLLGILAEIKALE